MGNHIVVGAEPSLSPQEQKEQLYLRQKALLDKFLQNGAITRSQYDKSFGDLTDKMGMRDLSTADTVH